MARPTVGDRRRCWIRNGSVSCAVVKQTLAVRIPLCAPRLHTRRRLRQRFQTRRGVDVHEAIACVAPPRLPSGLALRQRPKTFVCVRVSEIVFALSCVPMRRPRVRHGRRRWASRRRWWGRRQSCDGSSNPLQVSGLDERLAVDVDVADAVCHANPGQLRGTGHGKRAVVFKPCTERRRVCVILLPSCRCHPVAIVPHVAWHPGHSEMDSAHLRGAATIVANGGFELRGKRFRFVRVIVVAAGNRHQDTEHHAARGPASQRSAPRHRKDVPTRPRRNKQQRTSDQFLPVSVSTRISNRSAACHLPSSCRKKESMIKAPWTRCGSYTAGAKTCTAVVLPFNACAKRFRAFRDKKCADATDAVHATQKNTVKRACGEIPLLLRI